MTNEELSEVIASAYDRGFKAGVCWASGKLTPDEMNLSTKPVDAKPEELRARFGWASTGTSWVRVDQSRADVLTFDALQPPNFEP